MTMKVKVNNQILNAELIRTTHDTYEEIYVLQTPLGIVYATFDQIIIE